MLMPPLIDQAMDASGRERDGRWAWLGLSEQAGDLGLHSTDVGGAAFVGRISRPVLCGTPAKLPSGGQYVTSPSDDSARSFRSAHGQGCGRRREAS